MAEDKLKLLLCACQQASFKEQTFLEVSHENKTGLSIESLLMFHLWRPTLEVEKMVRHIQTVRI
ncbi:hypothetical protein AB4Y32_36805 [Paraburkholderia phymatum]|uniref:Uncharacterized protein n=1 Tax=Paraburkholderia phymatum TaxID=148447 RepID=A0ACC6UCG3_9BURK